MANQKDTYLSLDDQYKVSYKEVIEAFGNLTPDQEKFYKETIEGKLPVEDLKAKAESLKGNNFDEIYELEKFLDVNPSTAKKYKQDKFAPSETVEEFTEWKNLFSSVPKDEKPKLKEYLQIMKTLNRGEKSPEEVKKGTELEKEIDNRVDDLIKGLGDLKIKLLSNVFLNENKEYHPERNSLVHIKIVTSRALKSGDKSLVNAALFHDISKFENVTSNPQGWPTSLGHDVKGAEYVSVKKDPTAQYICANHMKVKGWVFKKKVEGEDNNETGTALKPDTAWGVLYGDKKYPNPGTTLKEKAENLWKLITFSRMDNMIKPFNLDALNNTWKKISSQLKDEMSPKELEKIWNENSDSYLLPTEVYGADGKQVLDEVAPKETTPEENEKKAKEDAIKKHLGGILSKLNQQRQFKTILPQLVDSKDLVDVNNPEAIETAVKKILNINESRKWVLTYESFRHNYKK